MYEIGDKVRYRDWVDKPWDNDEWVVITRNEERFNYEIYYSYTIQNLRTKNYQYEVNWQQIEMI